MAELDVLFCRNHLPAAPQICLHFWQEKIFNLKIEKQGILIFYAATLKYKNHIVLYSRSLKDKCCGRGGITFPLQHFIDRNSLSVSLYHDELNWKKRQKGFLPSAPPHQLIHHFHFRSWVKSLLNIKWDYFL